MMIPKRAKPTVSPTVPSAAPPAFDPSDLLAAIDEIHKRLDVLEQQKPAAAYDDSGLRAELSEVRQRTATPPPTYDDTGLLQRLSELESTVGHLVAALGASTRGDKVTLSTLDDLHQRLIAVEGAARSNGSITFNTDFLTEQQTPDEADIAQTSERLTTEYNELLNAQQDSPSQHEKDRFRLLTANQER